jgi:hypothetical protein
LTGGAWHGDHARIGLFRCLRGGDVMLVVENNGKTTVVSGWRAWVMALGVVLGVVAVVGFLGFIFLSVALTIGAVLLIAVPVAVGFAIVGALFGRR